MSRATRFFVRLTALFVGTLTAAPARADLIFFKDGFVFQGRVRRDHVTEFDSSTKEMVTMPQGFFFASDGARRLYFSPTQVRIVEKMPEPLEVQLEVGRVKMLLNPQSMPPVLEVADATDWDRNWERTVRVRTETPEAGPFRFSVKQVMAELRPSYFRADATAKVVWHAGYLTKELAPEALQALVDNNFALKDTATVGKERKPPDEADIVARRMRKIDFYGQGGFLGLADQELARLAADYPSQRERVESTRRALAKLRARDRLEEVKRWQRGGRHDAVRKALDEFPTADVPESILSEVRELRGRGARAAALVKETGRALTHLTRGAVDPKHLPLAAAADKILDELHPDTVDRLDAFLGQARQADRQRAAGVTPSKTPGQLLALAVSGWLLGSASSEDSPEAALNLWKTRGLLQAYLAEDESGARQKLLADYTQTVTPRVELDEIASLIPTLPPVAPAKNTGTAPAVRQAGAGRRAVQYHVQLPPEYTHARAYPVLVALHDAEEQAPAMLERWAAAGAENGFIVVAPEWRQGRREACDYSEAEHHAVLAALRDVKRSYQVDSDRVFLFGLGEGGRLAFDVGLANPSLFAGLVPMGAAPFYYPARCWRNAQYLPMYVVNGSRAGPSQVQLKQMFDNWIVRNYPTLWLTYVGRGQEWFPAEVPTICDWMSRQARAMPLRELGSDGLGGSFGNEFMTLRDGGNRFYWVSIDEVSPRNTVPSIRIWNNAVNPATVTARIGTDPDNSEGLVVNASAGGVRRMSLWVVRTARGRYNLDPDKPVKVVVGLTLKRDGRRVTPSLGVLLEDLYERADRQQLVVGRIEIKP